MTARGKRTRRVGSTRPRAAAGGAESRGRRRPRRTPKRGAARRRRRGGDGESALSFEGFHLLLTEDAAATAVVTAKNAIHAALGSAEGWRVALLPASAREVFVSPAAGTPAPPVADAWEHARALAAQPGVASAEVAFVGPGLEPPNPARAIAATEKAFTPVPSARARKSFGGGTPLTCSLPCDWHLDHIKAPQPGTLPNATGKGIFVAHPDTGYTLHYEIWSTNPATNRVHPEQGLDFVNGDADPLDDLVAGPLHFPGHGTATASVIMSDRGGPQTPFVSGVAPEAALVPLRVSTSVVHLSYGNLVAALRHATACQHHVVSMSLGGPLPSEALARAVADAIAAGLIVIAAAGNYYPFVVFPAALHGVVAVAASNCKDEPWQWSASGAAVDVTAPGESVWIARTAKAQAYGVEQSSGTSFATAATAGAAALWLSHHGRPSLIARYGKENLARVFRDLLVTHGVHTSNGWDTTRFGAGILDVRALLAAPLPATPPPAPHAGPISPAAKRLATIANFFPRLERDALRDGLAALLSVEPSNLDAALGAVGEELAVHMAVDPTLREQVLRHGGRTKRVVPERRAAAVSSHLRTTASKSLRRQLGMRGG